MKKCKDKCPVCEDKCSKKRRKCRKCKHGCPECAEAAVVIAEEPAEDILEAVEAAEECLECVEEAAEESVEEILEAVADTEKKTCPVCKAVKTAAVVTCVATGALFTVYMFNIDQKLLAWTYARVNDIFDRKPVDIKF